MCCIFTVGCGRCCFLQCVSESHRCCIYSRMRVWMSDIWNFKAEAFPEASGAVFLQSDASLEASGIVYTPINPK